MEGLSIINHVRALLLKGKYAVEHPHAYPIGRGLHINLNRYQIRIKNEVNYSNNIEQLIFTLIRFKVLLINN